MKPKTSLLELRAAAAASSITLLRNLRNDAPHEVGKLLAFIEAHLFDGDLTIEDLKQVGGPGAEAALRRFHHTVGLPPKALVESLHMRTAANLLRSTDLSVTRIASLVTHSSHSVFTQRFQRWIGISPADFRRHLRQSQREQPDVPVTPANLDRALRRELKGFKIEAFQRKFFSMLGRQAGLGPAGRKIPSRMQIEAQLAELEWREWQHLSSDDRHQRLLTGHTWQTPALFHLLCRKSSEAVGHDAQEAFDLARLALTCLDGLLEILPEAEYSELQALGIACARQAQHLQSDVLTGEPN